MIFQKQVLLALSGVREPAPEAGSSFSPDRQKRPQLSTAASFNYLLQRLPSQPLSGKNLRHQYCFLILAIIKLFANMQTIFLACYCMTDYFFKRSRISLRSSISSGGGGGAAGAASSFFLRLFMALITKKMQSATIRKSRTVWMKTP